MDEGRTELQRVILQYQKQRSEAIRVKQEAEVVLPYLRAALEELDAATGAEPEGEAEKVQVERFQASAEPKAEPVSRPTFESKGPDRPVEAGHPEQDAEDDAEAEQAAKPSFARHSIASLVGEAAEGGGS